MYPVGRRHHEPQKDAHPGRTGDGHSRWERREPPARSTARATVRRTTGATRRAPITATAAQPQPTAGRPQGSSRPRASRRRRTFNRRRAASPLRSSRPVARIRQSRARESAARHALVQQQHAARPTTAASTTVDRRTAASTTARSRAAGSTIARFSAPIVRGRFLQPADHRAAHLSAGLQPGVRALLRQPAAVSLRVSGLWLRIRGAEQSRTARSASTCNPGNAAVYVDGNYVGEAINFGDESRPLSLTAGTHRIELDADGYEPVAFDVNIVPGQLLPYQGSLQPAY